MLETLELNFAPQKITTTPVLIGKNLLETLYFPHYASKCSQFFLLVDSSLKELGAVVKNNLLSSGLKVELIYLTGGEECKSRKSKEKIEEELLKRGCNKDSCLIVIGGGSIIDLIGFVAAIYCRGIPYLSIPTTLLAMTDASIGGKTGINIGPAKNFIGAIYQPKAIIIDVKTLDSLSENEILSGLMESIKHGLISDEELLFFIESHLNDILNKHSEVLISLIKKSIKVKKSIVEKDEKEQLGLRHLLNFGHTIGHALESLMNYTIRHGNAVAFGILVEAYLSHYMGYLSYRGFSRISQLVYSVFEPFELPQDITYEKFYEVLCRDKKSLKGVPRFVMLREIGYPMEFDGEYVTVVPQELLKKAFKWMTTLKNTHAMCSR